MEYCFADPSRRPRGRRAGRPQRADRRPQRGRRLPRRPPRRAADKTAALSFCTRADFAASALGAPRDRRRDRPRHRCTDLTATSRPTDGARPARTWSPRRSPSSPTSGCSRRRRTATAGGSTCGRRRSYALHRAPARRSSTGSSTPASIARTVDGEPADARRAGASSSSSHDVLGIPDAAAADLPRGDREHARLRGLEARRTTGSPSADLVARRLPGDRGRDDRGAPRLRRQQRPDRLRGRRLRGLRAGDRCGRPAASGSPYAATRRSSRWPRRRTEEELYRAELGEDVLVDFAQRLRDLRARPGRLPSTCRCTRGSGATSSRSPSPPTWPGRRPRAARRGRRRLPRAAVDPHLLQPSTAPTALREDRARDPEHGLPARALAGLHGAPRRRSTTGSPSSWPATTTLAAAASRSSGSTPRSAAPATPTTGCRSTSAVPQDVAALWRESPVPRLGRRRAAGDDGVAAAPRPRRQRRSSSG